MNTSDDRKQAWLDHCRLNNSAHDRRLRDRVTLLFDLEKPTRLQQEILARADLRKSLFTLPANAYRQQHDEFIRLIKRELLLHNLKKYAPLTLAALLFAGVAAIFVL
jgi:hypothetical protein